MAWLRWARGVGPAGQVIGVDLSGRMLRQSRRRAARARCTGRIRLIQADAHRLPLAAAFDAVWLPAMRGTPSLVRAVHGGFGPEAPRAGVSMPRFRPGNVIQPGP